MTGTIRVSVSNQLCYPSLDSCGCERQISWKPSEEEIEAGVPRDAKCKIFLGYTSNMVSAGMRETIKYLVKHKMVSLFLDLYMSHKRSQTFWALTDSNLFFF